MGTKISSSQFEPAVCFSVERQTMTRKKFLAIGICLPCLLLVGLVVTGKRIYNSMLSETVSISDVSKPWQHRCSNTVGSLFNGHLRVLVFGHLNGSAKIDCAGIPIELTAGDINKYIDESEYWGNTCDVYYEPGSASTGQLSVRAIIGWSPDWTYSRPVLDEPCAANYTGGWTTYFPPWSSGHGASWQL